MPLAMMVWLPDLDQQPISVIGKDPLLARFISLHLSIYMKILLGQQAGELSEKIFQCPE
jgi:hypothetical protein